MFIHCRIMLHRGVTLNIQTGMDLLGGVHTSPSPGQGGAIFHDKAKDKMRYSNLSNNMMISEL